MYCGSLRRLRENHSGIDACASTESAIVFSAMNRFGDTARPAVISARPQLSVYATVPDTTGKYCRVRDMSSGL